MVAEILLGLSILFIAIYLLSLFTKRYDRKKEEQFMHILNNDISLNCFKTNVFKEYIIEFTNKKGIKEKYPVLANSKEEAKILFLEETGESYLRILNVT